MLDITLRQMEYFLAVLSTGSMTKAAEQCHASQSATSTAIAQLEKSLGSQLFVRTRASTLSPTEVAQHFARYARQAVEASESAQTVGAEVLRALTGTIRIGSTSTVASAVYPPLVRQCSELFPELTLELTELSPNELQREVRDGRVDIGLVYSLQSDGWCEETLLAPIRMHAMLPTNHQLARSAELFWEQIIDEPAILLDAPPTVDLIFRQARRLGLDIQRRWELRSMQTIRNLVAEGFGYSLTNVPESSAGHPGVVCVPLSDSLLDNAVVALHLPGSNKLRKYREVLNLLQPIVQRVVKAGASEE